MLRDRDPAARELVVECDAFVAGRDAEDLLARKRPVPAWAWVNLFAHGSESDLREAMLLGAPGFRSARSSGGRLAPTRPVAARTRRGAATAADPSARRSGPAGVRVGGPP